MSFGLGLSSGSSISSSLGDLGRSAVFLGSGKVQSKGGLGLSLLGLGNFLLLTVDNFNSSIDSIFSCDLLVSDLVDVILDWDVSVWYLNQIGSG